jgi:NADPH2:quinone reductase
MNGGLMKAIRVHQFGGPEVLKLEELPPLQPGPGQVLVSVKAVGVNPVETYIRSGNYGAIPLPYTPGGDAAGLVQAVGQGVQGWAPGQRVYTARTASGAYAEQALCEPGQLHPLPEKVSFAQGAALGVPYGTAFRALFQKARAVGGETVLVHGASGGVGLAAVQLARAAGLRVVATAGSEKGRIMVLAQGAHEVLDHRSPGHWEALPRLGAGRGVDVILEMLANVNLGRDLKVLAPGGRVVVVGSRGPVEIDARDLMGRDASILGTSGSNATEKERAAAHAAIVAGLENGSLRPVVAKELPLTQAAEAQRLVMEHPEGAQGKIVLIP